MLEQEIRLKLLRYLAGALSASDLEDRLPDGWELDQADEPSARALTLEVMGYLAEFSMNDRSEGSLNSEIRRLSGHPTTRTSGTALLIRVPEIKTHQISGGNTRLVGVPE